jgi:hypothetical protein
MKIFFAFCFAMTLGLSLVTSAFSQESSFDPDWILDLETGIWTYDGDHEGVWVCGDTCTYFLLPRE